VLLVCVALETAGAGFQRGALHALAGHALRERPGHAPLDLGPFSWSHPERSPSSADLFGEAPRPLAVEPLLLKGVLRRFDAWLRGLQGGAPQQVTLAGFAVAPDLAYFAGLYGSLGLDSPFAQAPLELRSLAMGVFSTSWGECSLERLLPRLGLLPPGALGDPVEQEAELAAEVLRSLLKISRQRSVGAQLRG